MGLQQFEQRLERLVEGVFARASRSGLQPVELGRRLVREMDHGRTLGVRGTIAPNRFTFAISPADAERFAPFAEALHRELEETAREHARKEGYRLLGPVEITVEPDPELAPSMFLVASTTMEQLGGGLPGSIVGPEGERMRLGAEPLVIGRMPECDVVLSDSNVSRRHAEVRRDGELVLVVDLDSTNGTKVNGTGIRQSPLNDGDVITIGPHTLRFEAG